MDREELIQVSFQIPPSALDSLSRLAEQLRLLTETANSPPAPGFRPAESEYMESGSFDPARFQALQHSADPHERPAAERPEIGEAQSVSTTVGPAADAQTATASISPAADAKPVTATVSSPTENAKSASAGIQQEPPEARDAGEVLEQRLNRMAGTDLSDRPQDTLPERRDIPPPPAETPQAEWPENIPSVQANAASEIPDAPQVRQDVMQPVPDAEDARAAAVERDLTPVSVQDEVSGGIETPLGAGVVVQTQPDMPQGRWSGVTEELVIPGPAPLTAEAVSLAFERDGRRYDNGFPLY